MANVTGDDYGSKVLEGAKAGGRLDFDGVAKAALQAPRFAPDFDETSAALKLSATQRNRLRWVARYDDQRFFEMLEAIENAVSDDPVTAGAIIQSAIASRARAAESEARFRRLLAERSKMISAFLDRENATPDELSKSKRLLKKCGLQLNYPDVRLLKLHLLFIRKKHHLGSELDASAPLRDDLYGAGSYGEPGSVRSTELAVFRNGRALPGIQASAALELVETRRLIERSEERDRRGGRPRKGTSARSAHARGRITPETKGVLEELAAAGTTVSDVLETLASGYRKACKDSARPPAEPRALLIAIAAALQQH